VFEAIRELMTRTRSSVPGIGFADGGSDTDEGKQPNDPAMRTPLPYYQTRRNPMDLPIVCSLNESELSERRRTILADMRTDVIDTVSLSNRYRYEFLARADILTKLADLVNLEHQCCRFLTFTISVGVGDAPIRLEVTGPPESKPMIAEFFGT